MKIVATKVAKKSSKNNLTKKNLAILLFLLIPFLILMGCTNESVQDPGTTEGNTEKSTRVITDMMGREVEVPSEINSIICTGSGALRLVAYADAIDLVVGV